MAFSITFNSNLEEVLSAVDSQTGAYLVAAGALIQSAAADNSPVRTGALRSSWTVEVESQDNGGTVTIGVPMDKLKGNYAHYVEGGTSRQKAQHMLLNAVNENMGQLQGLAFEHYTY